MTGGRAIAPPARAPADPGGGRHSGGGSRKPLPRLHRRAGDRGIPARASLRSFVTRLPPAGTGGRGQDGATATRVARPHLRAEAPPPPHQPAQTLFAPRPTPLAGRPAPARALAPAEPGQSQETAQAPTPAEPSPQPQRTASPIRRPPEGTKSRGAKDGSDAGERSRTSTLSRAHGSEPCLSTSSSTPAGPSHVYQRDPAATAASRPREEDPGREPSVRSGSS